MLQGLLSIVHISFQAAPDRSFVCHVQQSCTELQGGAAAEITGKFDSVYLKTGVGVL